MWYTEESDYVACRALRSLTMWHVGHCGVRLCGMWDTVESDYVASGTLWSQTMWQVGHCGVRLCGMGTTPGVAGLSSLLSDPSLLGPPFLRRLSQAC